MGIVASSGLASGINYQDLIAKSLEIEQGPITLLQERKASLQTVSVEYNKLSLQLSTLKGASSSLASISSFNPNTVSTTKTSAGIELLSATVSKAGVAGSYQVHVNQLAQAHSLASQGFVDQTTTAVASSSGSFSFRVGGGGKDTTISVGTTTTLTQLRDAINSAGGDVSASILNDGSGSNPYRLVLSGNDAGGAKTVTITSNPTTLDFTNKKVEAAYAATTNSFTGTVSSNEGNTYTGTTNKSLLVKIVGAGAAGVATYKYSIDGGITFKGANGAAYDGTNAITSQAALTNYIDSNASSNTTNEGVKVAFGAGTLAADDVFTVDVFNPTLQSAQDAVIQVGNSTLTRPTNTVDDAIQGVTLNLLKADSGETIDLQIKKDTTSIRNKVKDFVTAYNAAIKYVNDQLTFDPKVAGAKPLLGESTATILKKQIQDTITSAVPGAGTEFNSLSAVGVTSSKGSGQLTLDEADLSAALSKSLTDVTRVFSGIGVASQASIEFVGKTTNTRPGAYSIQVTTVPTKATITGGGAVPAGGITSSEILTVSLYTDATNSTSTPLAASVTLGAGSKASDIVNALNSAFATKGMAVSASKNSDNKIVLTGTHYGDDFKIVAFSNQAATNQSGIGTTTLSSQGVDIAGLLNGHPAVGVGETLTSKSGFPESGLKLKAPVTTVGSYGTIAVSSGAADRLASFLDTATKSKGRIETRVNGISSEIGRIDKDIARKNQQLGRLQQRLTEQFARLESTLAKFQVQSQSVGSSLSSLSNLAVTISKR